MSEYEVAEGIRSAHVYGTDWEPEDSNIIRHAAAELRAAGLFSQGSDYDGMAGQAVMELVTLFASQRHSGMSAGLVMDIFAKVAMFENLTPITDHPDEWMQVHDGYVDPFEPPLWQSCRKSSLFSNDMGKTYYDVNDKKEGCEPVFHKSKEHASA